MSYDVTAAVATCCHDNHIVFMNEPSESAKSDCLAL